MEGQLTLEYAETVKLPLNPISRNQEVRRILNDPNMVGGDKVIIGSDATYILKNASDAETKPGILVEKVIPFLGRRALVSTALMVEMMNKVERRNQI